MAAQRVGNAEWALDEMAESSLRRLIYRWRLVLNIVFPAVLLLFGALVAFFVIGFFLPLVSLIQGLL
jgi:type II secretory pathway component PulF